MNSLIDPISIIKVLDFHLKNPKTDIVVPSLKIGQTEKTKILLK